MKNIFSCQIEIFLSSYLFVSSRISVKYRCFEKHYASISAESKFNFPPSSAGFSLWLIFLALKMEAICSPKTSNFFYKAI